MTRLGKSVRMVNFKEENHFVSDPKAWELTMDWFDQWLKPKTSSTSASNATSSAGGSASAPG
jgi:hypothetical protein